MNYRNYITIEPNKRSGKPCVRGLRITVYEVLEYLASDMTEAEILEDFPDLTREDFKACIAYAADRERRFMNYQQFQIQNDFAPFQRSARTSKIVNTVWCKDLRTEKF